MRLSLSILFLAASAASIAFAQDASLAPGDSSVFIQINNLAELRRDDLAKINILPSDPAAQRAWNDLQKQLGLDTPQILDRYLGKKLILIAGPDAAGHPPTVILSAVAKPDAETAIAKLGLKKADALGDFTIYQPQDGGGRVAYDGSWAVMADPSDTVFIRRVLTTLTDKSATLADDSDYKLWSSRVAPNADAFLFSRDAKNGEAHAASLARVNGDVVVQYAGTSPHLRKLLEARGEAHADDFGPLPSSTIAAVSLNIAKHQLPERFIKQADGFLAPRSFAKDVLPNLAAPLVVFLAELPADQIDPPPPFAAPVAGFALRLKDAAVAADFTRIIDGYISLANISAEAANPGKTIRVKTVGEGDNRYRVADLRALIPTPEGAPQFSGAFQLAYGRVGDWFLLCTHEAFYKQCLQTLTDESSRLTAAPDVRDLPIVKDGKPVMTALVRSPKLAAQMNHWLTLAETDYPQFADAPPVELLKLAAEHLAHSRGIVMQVHQLPDDPQAVTAKIHILRKASRP